VACRSDPRGSLLILTVVGVESPSPGGPGAWSTATSPLYLDGFRVAVATVNALVIRMLVLECAGLLGLRDGH